jgi:hypothetical protein
MRPAVRHHVACNARADKISFLIEKSGNERPVCAQAEIENSPPLSLGLMTVRRGCWCWSWCRVEVGVDVGVGVGVAVPVGSGVEEAWP